MLHGNTIYKGRGVQTMMLSMLIYYLILMAMVIGGCVGVYKMFKE